MPALLPRTEVCAKPNRLHAQSLNTHARNLARDPSAGDISANHVASASRLRGTAELVRYHVTQLGAGGGEEPHTPHQTASVAAAAAAASAKKAPAGKPSAPPPLRDIDEPVRDSRRRSMEPLSPDDKRHEIRKSLQEMMSRRDTMAVTNLDKVDPPKKKYAGWDRPLSGRPLTPSQSARQGLRYHDQVSHPRDAPVPKQDSYEARQECRFYAPPSPRARSADDAGGGRAGLFGLSKSKSSRENGFFQEPEPSPIVTPRGAGNAVRPFGFGGGEAAGRQSDTRRRYDTPGGQETSLGRTRSMTPDYWNRYRSNVAGTSLPGSFAAGAESPPLERQRSARRVADCDPRVAPLTSYLKVQHMSRYHHEGEGERQLARRHAHGIGVGLSSSSSMIYTPKVNQAGAPPAPTTDAAPAEKTSAPAAGVQTDAHSLRWSRTAATASSPRLFGESESGRAPATHWMGGTNGSPTVIYGGRQEKK